MIIITKRKCAITRYRRLGNYSKTIQDISFLKIRQNAKFNKVFLKIDWYYRNSTVSIITYNNNYCV
jgi:hypothetical protein